MSEFTYLFRGRRTAASPEQQQKTVEKWIAWFDRLKEDGCLANAGHPLEHAGAVVSGKGTIKDGPYAEAKDVVGGFIVVNAADLEQACELAQGCPILETGGTVEVRPVQVSKR